MSFLDKIGWQYFINPFKEWRDITGRSTVKEFWIFVLYAHVLALLIALLPVYHYIPMDWYFNLIEVGPYEMEYLFEELSEQAASIPSFTTQLAEIQSTMLEVMEKGIKHRYLVTCFELIIMVPAFSLLFRRLQDMGKSGWWHLILFVLPPLGMIYLLVLTLSDSQKEANKWGTPPIN